MANSLNTYIQYAGRALRAFLKGLPAALAALALLAAAPAALAQNQAEELGEDYISDIFMEASEGMTPSGVTPPPLPTPQTADTTPAAAPVAPESQPTDSVPAAAPEPPAPESSPVSPPEAQPLVNPPAASPPPVIAKQAGKPFLHKLPGPAEPQAAPLQTAQNGPKSAGKPPLHGGGDSGAEMPTAVLEPESPSQPPAAATDTPPAATEERPLPIPPENGAAAPADQGEGDYFLGPDELTADNETGANSVTMPINLGALPSLQWETTDPKAPTANFISNSPLPQFDSSESNWKQLEIGQADVVAPPPPPESPGSVSTLTEPETSPPKGGGPATDREQLRSLFNDMLPPPGQGARPASGGSAPANQEPPRTTPETDGQTAAKPLAKPPAASSGETNEAAPPSETPADPAVPESPEAPDYDGSSAILRAGGQLTARGRFGEAAILPPLTGAPDLAAWMEEQQAQAQQAQAEETKAAPPQSTEKPGSSPPAKNSQGPAPAAKPRAAAPVRSQLTLVNETGNDRMLEIYRSVLSQMGYTIVSAETRRPVAAPTGQTIITYRPGAKAKARGLAAHLPGRKTLVETPAAMPTEISVLLR